MALQLHTDGRQLVHRLRDWGHELGFSQIGVAGVDLGEAGFGGPIKDGLRKNSRAARIEGRGDGVFVEQRLDLRRRAVLARFDKRRAEVADRDGGEPALGLRGLAGIVDDERVEVRHRPERHLGVA